MRRIKTIVALMMAVMVLLLMSGCAEEPTGAQIPITPTNQDTPQDVLIPITDTSVGEVGNGDTPTLEISALELDTTSADLDYSQRLTIRATTFPSGETLLWSSSDEAVATLSAENGRSVEVVAVNEGTSTITCTAGTASRTCTVTVNAPKTLQITGVDYPATYSINGRGWKIRNGTVASTVDLTSLTSVIKNVNGEEVGSAYTHTFNEGTRRFDIRGIDSFVPFSRITEAGAFTWTLTATDVGGRTVTVDLPINAVNNAETVVGIEDGSYSNGTIIVPTDSSSNAEQAAGSNLLVGTGIPVSQAFNTPTAANGNNFQTFDPYHTYGKQTLKTLGFAAGDKVTISFDWSISKNGNLDLLFGNFRAEWVGWKDDKDGQYIGAIQNPIDTFSADHTQGHAQFTVTLSEEALQAHTLRIRVDVSTLTLTLSHAKLERGEVANPVWTPAAEDIQATAVEENIDPQNLLVDTNVPISRAFNTPAVPEEKNFEIFDPYHTNGKQTLKALGFAAGDKATISFDWSISKNGNMDFQYGNFRAEWVGWKDGKDGQYIGAIQNPIDTFSADHTQGHAQFTVTLSEEALQAHTIRIRVDNSVLTLTISNAKLVRGEV